MAPARATRAAAAGGGTPFERVRAACSGLRLNKATPASWEALRAAECAFSFDLEFDIEHVDAKALGELKQALDLLRPDADAVEEVPGTKEFWEWLAAPAGGASGVQRARALLVVLGQACGNSSELVGAAGAAYLSLLSVRGADRQWSVLFQPSVFQQILRALRVLRRGELRQKQGRKDRDGADAAAGGEADAAMADGVEEEGAPRCDDDQDKGAGRVPTPEAVELLGKLNAFLLGRGLASSAEAAALVVDELAALVLRPSEDAVARQAAVGLSSLIARSGGPDDIRRTAALAIRATMPAVLMTQDRLGSFQGAIPRPLQQARATALNFVCGVIRSHPELLTPQAAQPADPAREEDSGEPQQKRRRRNGGKRADDDGSDGDREEEDDEDPKAGADKEGDEEEVAPGAEDGCPDGEKKVRRRRPRGSGVNDPIVALLELICVLTPDRSEWRGFSAETVMALLCEAADVERKLQLAEQSAAVAGRRLAMKTKDPGWPSMDVEQTAPPLPICEGSAGDAGAPEACGAGTLVAATEPAPQAAMAPGAGERFMAFLERILESERVSTRVLATELAVTSLERSGRLAPGVGAEDARAGLVKKLLLALTRRCVDGVPSVRSRALGGVSTALQFLGKSADGARLLRRIVLESSHPQYVDLRGMFRTAAADEKPMVRRASLTLFDAVVLLLQSSLGLESEQVASFFDMRVMVSLSADESVIVRKASVSSLASLLRCCPLPSVCEAWARNVLPLVLDVEVSVAQRALDEVEASVLNPLAEQSEALAGSASKSSGRALPRLPAVLDKLDSEGTELLQRALRQSAKQNDGELPPHFAKSLVCAVKGCLRPLPLREWPVAVWSMLEEVVSFARADVVDFDTILSAWLLFCANECCGESSGRSSGDEMGHLGTKILAVLEELVPKAPQERTTELLGSLRGALLAFSAPPSMIRGMMRVVERVEGTWKEKKVRAEAAGDRAAWRASILSSIQSMLGECVRADAAPKEAVHPGQLCACLFTLGELALVDPSTISQTIITQVQTIATNTIWRDGQRVDTDPAARGHAFATLGKFCLKKEPLAKNSVELLVLHLSTSEPLVVRNNVLIALGDLCVHYTSLVDRFVPWVTDLLRDSSELLRKQAAMFLASLLSEDFIKLRGSIMLRFLYVLSDPCDSVRSFVECVFARILHQRNSAMFSQNFLDVICALNGWAGLANFQGASGNEEFSLQKSASRRVMIYRFMLALMTNDQKFHVCAQIVTTLLAAFVDAEEKIELPQTVSEPAGQTLSDGLALLCCKEMRICFTAQKASQDEDGEAEGNGGDKATAAAAARGVLSSLLKRNMCENIVPVLVQLKNLMETKHSPFLRQLRYCLREILRDFKDDLKVMLSGDPQLASEIAFDLQAHEGGQDGAAAKAKEAPAPPCAGGQSRRVSLGCMLRTPGGASTPGGAPTPLADAGPPDLLPQPPQSACAWPRAGSGSPLIRRQATPLATPKALRSPGGVVAASPGGGLLPVPGHSPSLPIAASQGAASAARVPPPRIGRGKRRREGPEAKQEPTPARLVTAGGA